MILFAACCIFLVACDNEKKEDKDNANKMAADSKTAQCEITDARYTDIGKLYLSNLSSGDMTAWSPVIFC